MGYIRTKNEIIDLSKVTIGKDGWKNIEEYIAFKQESQEEKIKVADTIDDLLDGYICHKELVKDILVAKSYSKTYNLPIYGCIYVEEQGFIIVAKVVDILPDGEVSWLLRVH